MGAFVIRLFDVCTLVVMAFTVAVAALRFRSAGMAVNLALVYYAVLLGFAFGFPYSLNLYPVFAGAAMGVVMRVRRVPALRWIELGVFGYVMVRGVELLLGL